MLNILILERKVRKAPYKKSEAVKELESLAMDEARWKHPDIPEHILCPRKYSDRTSNDLTRCILDFLKFKGQQGERIACTGHYLDQSKLVTDTLGFTRRIGSGKWIKGSMQPGTADISATIQGLSVKIEIKIGKDRQSQKQHEYQNQVKKSGGKYIIVTSFQNFLQQYNTIINY